MRVPLARKFCGYHNHATMANAAFGKVAHVADGTLQHIKFQAFTMV